MSLDIQAQHFKDNGEVVDHEALEEWLELLFQSFTASEPAAGLTSQGWIRVVSDLGAEYFGRTIVDLRPEDLAEILWHLIPRKVSVEPDRAEDIIAEVRAFWSWLDVDHGVPHAADCLAALPTDAVPRLEAALADPRKWGMAKSFLMEGAAAGFDTHSPEQLEAWMLRLAAEGAAAETAAAPPPKRNSKRKATARKAQRKRQKKARRKNRR